MKVLQSFKTEGGARFQWTERQIEAYRKALASGAAEQAAIQTAHEADVHGAPMVRADDDDLETGGPLVARQSGRGDGKPNANSDGKVSLSPSEIYARRAAIYDAGGKSGGGQ